MKQKKERKKERKKEKGKKDEPLTSNSHDVITYSPQLIADFDFVLHSRPIFHTYQKKKIEFCTYWGEYI
jgi:hypothetical protein